MQQSIARMAAADARSWGHMGWVEEVQTKAKAKQRRGPCARAASELGVRLAGTRIRFETCHSSIGALCNLPRRVSATEDLITLGHSLLAGGCRGCHSYISIIVELIIMVYHGTSLSSFCPKTTQHRRWRSPSITIRTQPLFPAEQLRIRAPLDVPHCIPEISLDEPAAVCAILTLQRSKLAALPSVLLGTVLASSMRLGKLEMLQMRNVSPLFAE
jgi:hypothetical protein